MSDFSLTIPVKTCVACKKAIKVGEAAQVVFLQRRGPYRDGSEMARAAVFHERCAPDDETVQSMVPDAWGGET